MMIIAGLGNPGKKYEFTRHNIGFRIINNFAEENNFPEFKLYKKFNSLISESIINDKKIILAKPRTFMNKSGKAIKSVINFNNAKQTTPSFLPILAPPHQRGGGKVGEIIPVEIGFIVIHDDIDLPIGEIKISQNRGSAGHKGVKSIINALRTKNFSRIRIGILPKIGKPENTEQFVLEKFSESEEKILSETIQQSISILKNIFCY